MVLIFYFLVVFVLAHLQIHYYNSLCLAADVSWILPSIIRTPSAPNSVLASKRFVLLKTIQWCIFTVKSWLAIATLPGLAASRDAPAIEDGETRCLVLRVLKCTKCRQDQSNTRTGRVQRTRQKVSGQWRVVGNDLLNTHVERVDA